MQHSSSDYWAKFESIGTRLRKSGALANTPTWQESLAEIKRLVAAVESDISTRQDDLAQLVYWASDFCCLQAQIEHDLNLLTDAISTYERAIGYYYFYENAIRLIQALCEAGRVGEASSRVQELTDRGVSFEASNDPECAAKLLHILGTYSDVLHSAPRSLLEDALKTVAKAKQWKSPKEGNRSRGGEQYPIQLRSLVVTFREPAGRLLSKEPLCDQYGSVVDLTLNGVRHFCNEAPMVVQPDLLVDRAHNRIVGLSFELTSPEWMISRCMQMLRNLDSRAIRLSDRQGEDYVGLEILWGQSSAYEREFAQLDFGLWGFLYSTPEPIQLREGTEWTPPAGLVVGDVSQLGFDLELSDGEYVNVTAEVAMPEEGQAQKDRHNR